MKKENRKRNPIKTILKVILIIILILVVLVSALIVFLSVTEYKPEEKEPLSILGDSDLSVPTGEKIKILSWNVGYCALGDNADFFMDGGKSVYSSSKDRVEENLDAIISFIRSENPDLIVLQETDVNSDRSYHINEVESIRDAFDGYSSTFSYNFKVSFLPYPIPPMGKIGSGILTLSDYRIESAERIQLPVPFKWPVSMINLKRCLEINRLPVEGKDCDLILINLHLEAYDDGEGKIAQTSALKEILEEEYKKGNYVIAAGDFNQIFSSEDPGKFKTFENKWMPGTIDVSAFNDGWQFLMDEKVPSCRSLDQPYENAEKEEFQYYLIDGFIVSGNVNIESYETKDLGFINSDHNPVLMEITLD